MGCSNLHVRHEENGLLGSDESQLAAQIRRVVRDGALRRRLKASVTHAQAPADPNAQMLATLLDVHQNGARLQASPPAAPSPLALPPSQPPMPSCPRRPRRARACTPHPPRTSTARLALPKAAPVHTPPAGDVMAPRVEPLHAALGRRRPAGARLRTPRRPCDARRARCARLRAVLPTALRRTALRRCRAKPRHASQGAEAQPQPRSAQGGQSRLTARGPTAGSGEEP